MRNTRMLALVVAVAALAAFGETAAAQRRGEPRNTNGTGPSSGGQAPGQLRKITAEQRENVSRRIAIATEMVNQLQPQAKARGRSESWRRATLEALLALPLSSLEQLQGRAHDVDRLSDAIAAIEAPATAATTSDLVYTPIAPCRYIDTRGVGGKIDGVRGYDIALAGSSHGGDAPCNPTVLFGVGQDEFGAIAMNVTIVDPSVAPGFLAIKPTAAAGTTSLVNWYEAGASVQAANQGVITIDQGVATADEFVIQTSAPVHAIVDIFGAFIAPQWGTVATTVDFAGIVPSASCVQGPMGNNYGSTASLTGVTVATMFFDQAPVWLNTQYTKARLSGTCRGAGVIELRTDCVTIVASVNCANGSRPWTYASAEFDVASTGAYNVIVRATSGTLEWSGLKLVLYK